MQSNEGREVIADVAVLAAVVGGAVATIYVFGWALARIGFLIVRLVTSDDRG